MKITFGIGDAFNLHNTQTINLKIILCFKPRTLFSKNVGQMTQNIVCIIIKLVLNNFLLRKCKCTSDKIN